MSEEVSPSLEREAQRAISPYLPSSHTVELFNSGMADDARFIASTELLDAFDADAPIRRFRPVPVRAGHLVCSPGLPLALWSTKTAGWFIATSQPANIFLCRYGWA